MMKVGNQSLAALLLGILVLGNGCVFRKKKPNPPPSIPPNISHRRVDLPQPQPVPPPTPEPAPTIQPTPPPVKQKPKHTRKKPPVQAPSNAEPAIPEPTRPTPDASINAPMTNAQAERQKSDTSHLLGSAENNLSNIHRSLGSDEQQMVAQIRSYIAQSRKAMTDGDLERAYNLANKANLLSSELAKQ